MVKIVAFNRLLPAQILQQESQGTKTFVAISGRKKSTSLITYTVEKYLFFPLRQQAILQIQHHLRMKCEILHSLHNSGYNIWKIVT